MRRSIAFTAAVSLVALLALALPGGASAKPECPPPPELPTSNCVIPIDDHFVDDETCAFPLQVDAVGHVGYHPRFNKAGELIGESFTPSIRFLVTNPANGRAVTDADVGLDKARFLPDGSIEVLSTGIHAKARTDQNQTIFRRIGLQLIHIDAEGNETLEIVGGNFQPDEDFERLVCGYLAGG
jgi:hypothetical protein